MRGKRNFQKQNRDKKEINFEIKTFLKGKEMRTISEMYKRSGGTAYQHTCSECRFFRDGKKGKCLLYGGDQDWYGRYIACKFINSENDMPYGQMNIFDYV